MLCAVFTTLLTINGCKKDAENLLQTNLKADTNDWGPSSRSEDGPTVLGARHSIPYTVDIIKQAYNNLNGLILPLYQPITSTYDSFLKTRMM